MGGKGSGRVMEDIIGQKFERLTIKRLLSRHPIVWECVCECGKIVPITGVGKLRSGNTKSCGCFNIDRMSILSRKRPYESVYNNLVKLCSRKPYRLLEISYEEFVKFTTITECHYCGSTVHWTKYNANKNGFSYNLDRKDNNKGYTKDNVVVCCSRCNFGKGRMFSYEEWVEVGKCLRLFWKNRLDSPPFVNPNSSLE